MRKYAAILCAVAMLCGLCACKKADKPADTKPTATTTATTTTTTTTVAVGVKAPLNLTYTSPFSDGVALVRYIDADGVEWTAAINTAGAPLFHLPATVPYEGDGYRNGIRVVGDIIYDKSGAVLASPELSGYDSLMTGNCGGYVLAKKVSPITLPAPAPENTTTTAPATTTTAADTADTAGTQTTAPTGVIPDLPVTSAVSLSIGVLNNKGEWVHPLSTDHPIAQAITHAAQPAENLTYLTEDVLMVFVDTAATAKYYSFKNNTLSDNYAHYESINYQDEETGIYQIAADGTKKMVIADVVSDYFFKDAFIGRTTTTNEAGEVSTLVKLYDYTGKVLADLTDYPLWGNRYYYIYDRLIIPIDDGSGNRQLVILNKDGTAACDPVVLGLRDTFYPPDETGVVVESHTAEGTVSYCHYAWDGTATPYTDVATFSSFSEGLAAVTLTDGTLCYINHKAEIVIR